MSSIRDIQQELFSAQPGTRDTLYEQYKSDTRSGVQRLLERCSKQDECLRREQE